MRRRSGAILPARCIAPTPPISPAGTHVDEPCDELQGGKPGLGFVDRIQRTSGGPRASVSVRMGGSPKFGRTEHVPDTVVRWADTSPRL